MQATYREDAVFGGRRKGPGECIEDEEDQGLEMRKGEAEIDQSGYEDDEIENECSEVTEGHDEGE